MNNVLMWRKSESTVGAVAGALGKIAEHPLDTIKVRLQLQRRVPRDLRALYRGLPAPLLSGCAETSVLFGVHGHYAAAYGEAHTVSWVGGALAGCAVATFLTPMEYAKCHAQASGRSALQVGLRTRVPQLYGAHYVTLLREAPGSALWFKAHESATERLHARCGQKQGWHDAAGGVAAGVSYWTAVYPVDTVKTYMQVHNEGSAARAYARILKMGGPLGLYRGLGPTILRACPGNAVAFSVYGALFIPAEAMQ